MGTRWIEGAKGDGIAVDDTYFPIVVATFFGAATEPSVRGYFAWLDELLVRAKAERTPLVNITDAGLAGNPSADVRRLIAELTLAWGKAGADELPVTSYVVVDNAIIRGALTALGWLHGNLKSINVATCAEALEGGVAVLARAGKKPPAGLDPRRWKRPPRRP